VIEKIISLFATVSILMSNSFFAMPVNVKVAGTGSMYPTFPKSPSKVLMWRPIIKYDFKRGDIVTFTPASTTSGFIKRVIAIPGDTLELRDGQVWINGVVGSEPYTALSRSTFGDDFLPDCKMITIPENKYFVMGDNRKTSDDSRRKLGLVDKNDITEVLPSFLQKFSYLPRDESEKISINKNNFLKKINAQRKLPLKLRESAKNNIATVKLTVSGHYDADELSEAAIEWWKDYFLDPKYQEISIAEIDQEVNKCPSRTNVIYLGGYVPPNWNKSTVDSWQSALGRLREIRPSWKGTPVAPIIDTRIRNIEQVVAKMKANLWLPANLEVYVESTDKKLYDEQITLSSKLNSSP
jgi:signal peptidase I